MLTLALPLLLASVPCADLETDLRLLEETAQARPAELPTIVDGPRGALGRTPAASR